MEKVDFDLTYNPLRHLGHKLALNVIGELYARFSSPVGLDVTVALSNRFSVEDRCSQGTRRGASGPGLDSLGGRNGGEHRGLGLHR